MGAEQRRGRRTGWVLRAGLALGLLVGAAALPAQAARLLSAKGAEAPGYGRIVLTFDKPVAVKARMAGSVLILGYGEPASAGPERLADQMPGYVATVRRDPDGTGLRLALQRGYRVNLQEAGEQVFVDLLPESWSGAAPPLPQEVVAELARRARVAEAALRARNPPPVRRPLPLDIAHLPQLTRLTLRLPPGVQAEIQREGAATRLRVPGPWTVDASETRGRLKPALAALAAEADDASASLLLTPGEGYGLTAVQEDEAVTVDLTAPKTGKPEAATAEAKTVDAKAVDAKTVDAKAAEPRGGEKVSPAAPSPDPRTAGARLPPREADAAAMPTRPPGSGLVFPFRSLPPVALFERAGIVTLAFETTEAVSLPPAGESGLRALGEPQRSGSLVLLRFAPPSGRLVDLVPVAAGPGGGWELTAGESLGQSDALVPARRSEKNGRTGIAVALPQPGSATWLDLDGERVAVVTSAARRPAGFPKVLRFVDFDLLPSRFGLAVLARADDLTVRPDFDGVGIGRDGGLALTAVAVRPETALAEAETLVIEREGFERAELGNIREILRTQFAPAASAPLGARGPLRLAYARTLAANGLDPEALATLEAASADDPLVAAQRETAILRALVLVRIGRGREAKQALAGEGLARDPEAALWRAMAEAEEGNWREAEAGFRKTLALVARYPEALRLRVLATAAEAAIETGDIEAATDRIAQAGQRDLPPLIRDRLALVRARVEELTGQTVAALDSYGRLAEVAERPVATMAALRHVLLGQSTGAMKADAAVARLEQLAIVWHGGPIEEGVTAGLARAYVQAGRYRDAFALTQRANAAAPNSELSRTLTTEAQRLFDDLFVAGRGDRLPGIEAVALFFDFKDFMPIGRRGDEAVRRLADRLVGLDLLDSAAELLQHQVENRLTGPARAEVAARLATVRLMEGKPMQALEAIDSTFLPELPPDLRRARSLVRARALSDLSRTDLALETIEGEAGADAQRLRADILWAARRWRPAGEAHEALLGEVWRSGKPLDDAARTDVIRAGLAYALAGEGLGLERLKAKFAAAMAESADARTFALITAPNPTRQAGFREIAQRATSAETLASFLAEYRKRYPEAAVPDRGKPGAAAESRTDAPPRG